ncbi:uncharacterized protein LOC126844616 [Adelges cooleyi]|uniref:uncharacterized protein LOC126844616 n=1 Tax=Adelges cooleyi TaxID=133065 RepID=UPI00217F6A19|nr:uncharacterized protein LOC126844616 [Adelges cooleyi]
MPCRYQPKSLLSLSEDRVVSNLVQTCYQIQELIHSTQTMTFARNRMRRFWQSATPPAVRRRLLSKCMDKLADVAREGHSISATADAVPLCLLAVMLDKDINELKIQLCCYYGCSHQNTLLRLLAAEAKGLERLELTRPTLLRLDAQLFQSALLAMSNLKCLVLKNIACDKILKTVGQSCFALEKLDVSNSSQVTDVGIKNLLLQIEIRDKQKHSYATTKCGYRQTPTKMVTIMQTLRALSKKFKTRVVGDRTNIDDMSFVLEYCQKSTLVCSTLRALNMANTSVTSVGILLTLKKVPNLETLGEYCHVGRALELLDKFTTPTTTKRLQLTMANACRMTSTRLQALCDTCTRLDRLTISEPLHAPHMLGQLPSTLTKINLQTVPAEQTWVDELCKYLSGPQSRRLREVSIKFSRVDRVPVVDLSAFLPSLTDLETLSVDGAEMRWSALPTYSAIATAAPSKLEKLQLCKITDADTLRTILRRAPRLKVLHIYSLSMDGATSLTDVLNEDGGLTRNLNCLYVNQLFPCIGVDTIKSVVAVCPEISKIGNVVNWGGVTRDEIKDLNAWIQRNNYRLEPNGGSHWFCSECFPII